MVFDIKIKLKKFPTHLKPGVASRIIKNEFKTAVNRSLVHLRNAHVEASPSVTGLLKNSWVTIAARVETGFVRGRMITTVNYAIVVDRGAKPHFPPVGKEGTPALGPWIRRKFQISDEKEVRRLAFLIGRQMKRVGIKPRKVFQAAGLRVIPIIDREMEAAEQNVKRKLQG